MVPSTIQLHIPRWDNTKFLSSIEKDSSWLSGSRAHTIEVEPVTVANEFGVQTARLVLPRTRKDLYKNIN